MPKAIVTTKQTIKNVGGLKNDRGIEKARAEEDET
jgi:hypothetical protein